MEMRAKLGYLQIAPRKVRLVSDFISGMDIKRAKAELSFSKKRAAQLLLKLLNSAIFSAKKNFNFDEKRTANLYIKRVIVDEGPKLKRFRPVSRGIAHPIQKKMSHVTLVLDEKKTK